VAKIVTSSSVFALIVLSSENPDAGESCAACFARVAAVIAAWPEGKDKRA
jgi:hypothetical protein